MAWIPPFRLRPEPASVEAEGLPGFEYAPDEVGQRHQLGGEPTWLQGDATPVCGDCFDDFTSTSIIQST